MLVMSAADAELLDLDLDLATAGAGAVVLMVMLADSAMKPHNHPDESDDVSPTRGAQRPRARFNSATRRRSAAAASSLVPTASNWRASMLSPMTSWIQPAKSFFWPLEW